MAEINEVIPFDQSVSEQIGAQRRVILNFRSPFDTFIDNQKTDYKYWDKARRCKARGLELSGALIRPLTSKVSGWVLGDSPLWQTQNQRVSREVNQWWEKWKPSIMRGYQEALDLGDCYAVFNSDTSVTIVSPEFVDPIYDGDHYNQLIGYRITTTYTDTKGIDAQTIVDEYYADHRTQRVSKLGNVESATPRTFSNPLGKIPVVHIMNRFGADELNGRSIAEPLLPILVRYNDMLDTAVRGNIRQGRPTPVIEKMGTASQLDSFWEKFGRTETVTHSDGTTEEVDIIDFDPDQLLTLGGEAVFRYASPQSFSVDTQNFLGLLFYLVVQHSEIPEFIMGAAVGGSKASTDSQLEPFLRYIKKMRGLSADWIQELADLYVAYLAIIERRARNAKAMPMWKPMSAAEGRLMLDSIDLVCTRSTCSTPCWRRGSRR